MRRLIPAALVAATVVTAAAAQDGPLQRAGQALDRAGKNVRYRVESEVNRGQAVVQERDVLGRVTSRIAWDKRFVGSALQYESRAGGTILLRGSVPNEAAKKAAVELTINTIGVGTVIDELAIVNEVKVIQPKEVKVIQPRETEVRVIESTPSTTTETRVVVPPSAKVEKP